MAYLNANTWNVAAARRAGGLGDGFVDAISSLPNIGRDTSNLLQFDPGLSVSPSAGGGLLNSISSIAGSVASAFKGGTPPAYTASINIPTTLPPTTSSGINTTTLEYIGIAAGSVLLLALISGRRRR